MENQRKLIIGDKTRQTDLECYPKVREPEIEGKTETPNTKLKGRCCIKDERCPFQTW